MGCEDDSDEKRPGSDYGGRSADHPQNLPPYYGLQYESYGDHGTAGRKKKILLRSIWDFMKTAVPMASLKEDSQNVVTDALPLPDKEEIKKLILFGCNQAAAQGITELHSDDFSSDSRRGRGKSHGGLS